MYRPASPAAREKDPRRIFERATIARNEEGALEVAPRENQSSGAFRRHSAQQLHRRHPEGLDPVSEGRLGGMPSFLTCAKRLS